MRDATWDIDMHANSGAVATISWIEMFKVVNGVITDVWRRTRSPRQYPAGPWPEFEK